LVGLGIVVWDVGVLVVVVDPFLACCSELDNYFSQLHSQQEKKLTGQLVAVCSEKVKTVTSLVNSNVKNTASASEKRNVAV
jgi:hypothetical protein